MPQLCAHLQNRLEGFKKLSRPDWWFIWSVAPKPLFLIIPSSASTKLARYPVWLLIIAVWASRITLAVSRSAIGALNLNSSCTQLAYISPALHAILPNSLVFEAVVVHGHLAFVAQFTGRRAVSRHVCRAISDLSGCRARGCVSVGKFSRTRGKTQQRLNSIHGNGDLLRYVCK